MSSHFFYISSSEGEDTYTKELTRFIEGIQTDILNTEAKKQLILTVE
jgi:hypothetical protein